LGGNSKTKKNDKEMLYVMYSPENSRGKKSSRREELFGRKNNKITKKHKKKKNVKQKIPKPLKEGTTEKAGRD